MKKLNYIGFCFFSIAMSCITNINAFNSHIPNQINIGNTGSSCKYRKTEKLSHKQIKARKSAKKAENRARNKQY